MRATVDKHVVHPIGPAWGSTHVDIKLAAFLAAHAKCGANVEGGHVPFEYRHTPQKTVQAIDEARFVQAIGLAVLADVAGVMRVRVCKFASTSTAVAAIAALQPVVLANKVPGVAVPELVYNLPERASAPKGEADAATVTRPDNNAASARLRST